MSGHGAGHGGGTRAGGLTKTGIVLFLVAGLVLVHHFGAREGFDPSAMLALGFVVLASYAFGQLVERIRLPHITGYLLAGIVLGPSVATLLPAGARVPPFDAGVLSADIQHQLSPLVTLAVALIALTAGGELRIARVRESMRAIVGVIAGHLLVVAPTALVAVAAITGLTPAVTLPGLEGLDTAASLGLAGVAAAVVITASPAVAIAVVTETRAKGTYTTILLACVVLMDVVVVFLFSVASTFAAQTLGTGADVDIASYLLVHIAGSLMMGTLFGGVIALYLRFVDREILVFVLGLVFVGRYVADEFHLDPLLLFLAAGFVVSNFSTVGERLIETVERLSLPVYVVFFTLAGAHLDILVVAQVLPYAVGLFVLRIAAVFAGVRFGAKLGRAPQSVVRDGWTGFVSQAGVSISLASIVATRFGEPGEAIGALVLSTIAFNELVGPVLMKLGLQRAGDVGGVREASVEAVIAEPAPQPPAAPTTDGARRGPAPWAAPSEVDVWHEIPTTGAAQTDALLTDLRRDLERVAAEMHGGPIVRFKGEAELFQRELRRELLRLHRRVALAVQNDAGLPDGGRAAVLDAIRAGLSQLADRVRASVVGRAAKVRHQDESLLPIADALDQLARALPDAVLVPWRESTFLRREGDGARRASRRALLRWRRTWSRVLSGGLAPRRVALRSLASYHLGARAPGRLEAVAALLVQAELHQVARCRAVLETAIAEYGALARRLRANGGNGHAPSGAVATPDVASLVDESVAAKVEPTTDAAPAPDRAEAPRAQGDAIDLAAEVARVRAELDRDLELAGTELDHIARDLDHRADAAVADLFRDLVTDLLVIGTPDLDPRDRAPSRLFAQRNVALATLGDGFRAAREAAAASYALLSLELELVELQGRVGDVLREQSSELARRVRGRSQRQVERVREAIAELLSQIEVTLAAELPSAQLAEALKRDGEALIRVAADAHRSVASLRDELAAEDSVASVLDALVRASQALTEHYSVPATPVPRAEWKLPPPVDTVEIPFREWVVAHVETTLSPRIFGTVRGIAGAAEKLALSISELERRVAFNVELAAGELAPLGDEAPPESANDLVRSIVMGTLQRNAELFESYAAETERWVDEVQSGLETTLLEDLAALRDEIVIGQVSRLRVRLVRQAAQRRALRRRLAESRAAIAESAARIGRRARSALGETRLEHLRRAVGLPDEIAPASPSVATLAPPAPSSRVPVVYRRVFSAQALEAGDILTGRDGALEHALAALEDRGGAGLRTAALVGPDGVGKSAFIDAVLRGRKWKNVVRHELEAPATRDDVARILDVRGEGNLVIVSGLAYLFALRPGGAEPLRCFVDGVVRDAGKNAFLVRADDAVWAQASALAPLPDAFPEVVALRPLDVASLRTAVLARHGVSGYGLVFSDGERQATAAVEAIAARALASMSRPQDTFFRSLHDASGGLVRDALRIWLASVRSVDENDDLVHLGPVPPSPVRLLRRLDEDAVLTLYQVARQGWMDARVLGWLLALDEVAAEARLLRLAHLGVLARAGEHYRVPVHLRGSVHRLLTERRLLAPFGASSTDAARGGGR